MSVIRRIAETIGIAQKDIDEVQNQSHIAESEKGSAVSIGSISENTSGAESFGKSIGVRS